MVSSAAQAVTEYLAALPAERRGPLIELRKLILRRLPRGFEERMQYGMISYVVPLSRHPVTYNGQPLALVSLASQTQYMSLYLMGLYADPQGARWFAEGFRRAGKRLNMGKSCVRFKALSDLPLDVIGDAVARIGVDEFIALYERARGLAKGAGKMGGSATERPATARKKRGEQRAGGKKKKASPRRKPQPVMSRRGPRSAKRVAQRATTKKRAARQSGRQRST